MSYPYRIIGPDMKERSIDETLHRKFLEEVAEIEKQFDVELPQIKCVYMGNESNPFTEIFFPYDIVLHGKGSMGNVFKHNEEQIQLYKLRRF